MFRRCISCISSSSTLAPAKTEDGARVAVTQRITYIHKSLTSYFLVNVVVIGLLYAYTYFSCVIWGSCELLIVTSVAFC